MIDFETGEHYNSVMDYYNRKIPEYYPTMYCDGYSPQEIYIAMQKKLNRQLAERSKKKQMEKERAKMEEDNDYIVDVKTEVKIKK